ncbi:uncharacterized protein SEPMUDRAFT_114581 [Sphaerulina musiva SO2202]|uniref:Inhibitor I9 domain-containing protein n=1 Tax=Sphaerulina musiva (strain SO2202) TaxID=692275 RepID=M3B6R2_SPHMS|nr:uncharacterized protein SEPMUDRAFT_114581 [Sphaerulina musiva SO2202]EMF15487.1 hypothetical protein SEPMUDRAFT_114581 [Sphaerulina musiva SO2202]
MKFFIFVSAIVLTFLAIFGVAADQPMKQIIISYPKGTPASVLEEAKKYVLDAGGFISHEYNLIMGFAATAPAKILETLQAAGKDHNVLIEEDSTVSINNS